jgi:hypothetical protein
MKDEGRSRFYPVGLNDLEGLQYKLEIKMKDEGPSRFIL